MIYIDHALSWRVECFFSPGNLGVMDCSFFADVSSAFIWVGEEGWMLRRSGGDLVLLICLFLYPVFLGWEEGGVSESGGLCLNCADAPCPLVFYRRSVYIPQLKAFVVLLLLRSKVSFCSCFFMFFPRHFSPSSVPSFFFFSLFGSRFANEVVVKPK